MRYFFASFLSLILLVPTQAVAGPNDQEIGYPNQDSLVSRPKLTGKMFTASSKAAPGYVPIYVASAANRPDRLADKSQMDKLASQGWRNSGALFYASETPKLGQDRLRAYVKGEEYRYAAAFADQQAALKDGFQLDKTWPKLYVTAPSRPEKLTTAPLKTIRSLPTYDRSVLDIDSHNAFPTFAKLQDGTLLLAYRVAKEHHNPNGPNPKYAVKSYSFDNGKTWTKPERIKFPGFGGEDGVEGLTVPKYGPLAGRPVMVTSSVQSGERVTRIVAAKDAAGLDWEKPKLITYGSSTVRSIPSSAPIQVSQNDFVIIAYHTPGWHVAANRLSYTPTGWQLGSTSIIAKSEESKTYSEANATIAKINGKSVLVAFLRNEKHPKGKSIMGQSISTDGGHTWSTPTDAFVGYGMPNPITLADGRIMVGYRKASAENPMPAMYRIYNGSWSGEKVWGPAKRQMAYGWLVETSPGTVVGIWGKENSGYSSTIQRTVINP